MKRDSVINKFSLKFTFSLNDNIKTNVMVLRVVVTREQFELAEGNESTGLKKCGN